MRQNKLFLFLLSTLFSVGVMAQTTATALPFSTGFEDATDNGSWQFANATTNKWCIGSAVNNGGTNALYISNDDGKSTNYGTSNQTSFAYRAFHFEKGDYIISFDWQCKGEGTSTPYDFMQVVLTPASITIQGNNSGDNGTLGTITSFGKATTETQIEKAGYVRAKCAKPFINSYPHCFLKQETWVTGELFEVSIDKAGDYYLVFSWHNDTGVYPPAAVVDNVSITKKACGKVRGVVMSSITSSSVSLSWDIMEEAISYDYAVLPASVTLDETKVQKTTTSTATVNDLTPNTAYTVYIRATCTEGTGDWVEASFRTDCAAQRLPYSEGFEGTMQEGEYPMPYCWNKVSNTDEPYVYYSPSSWGKTDAYSGTHCLRFNGSSEQIAVLPLMEEDANKLYISFYYQNGTADYVSYGTQYKYPKLVVGAMSDPADKTTFVSVDTLAQSTSSYALATVYLNDVPATHKYIAIKHAVFSYSPSYIYVDDIIVDHLPTCIPVRDVKIEATTTTSATVAWKAGKDETNWVVKYVVQGAKDTVTTKVSGTPSCTINGLKPSMPYTYWVSVQSDCGGGDKAKATVATLSFATDCAAFTAVRDSIMIGFEQYTEYGQDFNDIPCWSTFKGKGSPSYLWVTMPEGTSYSPNTAYKGAMAAYVQGQGTYGVKSAVLATPELEIPEGSELSLYIKGSSTYAAQDSVIIYTNTEQSLTGATRIGKIVEMTSEYKFYRFSLPIRGNYYLLFESYNEGNLFVDNILISPEPACLPPTKLVLGAVESHSATFSWTPGKEETQWSVTVKNKQETVVFENEEVTGKPIYTIEDLDQATTDTFYVSVWSVCDNVPSVEVLTGTLIFTTTCDPLDFTAGAPGDTLLYRGFEADDKDEQFSRDEDYYWDPNKHICWVNKRLNATGPIWQVEQSKYNSHSGNQCLTIPDQSSARPEVLLALPAMTFNANQEIGLDFWMKATDSDSVIVYLNSEASLKGATRIGGTGDLGKIKEYTHYEFAPIKTLEGLNYLILYVKHNVNRAIYLDDMVVRLLPNCRRVKEAEIRDIATTSAKLAWTPAYEENTWNVVVKNGEDVLLDKQVTTPSVLLENLVPATKYTLDVTIAAVCDGVEAAEKYNEKLTFVTECEVISTFPWKEGFENMNAVGSIVTANSGPLCWNVLDANQKENELVYIVGSSTAAHTGSKGMTMVLKDYAKEVYAMLPAMENVVGKQLVFWRKNDSYKKPLEVGYLADVNDKTTWNKIAEFEGTTDWNEEKVVLTCPEEVTAPHFGFRYYTEYGSYSTHQVYIDDITVREVPVCDMATKLHYVDTLTTANTATFAWSGTADAGYTVIFRGNDTITKNVTDTFCVLDGLVASRIYKYEVSVVARCVAGEAIDTLTSNFEFSTKCSGPITQFPYNVGFEEEDGYKYVSTIKTIMPECVVANKVSGSSKLISFNSMAHSGTQCLYLFASKSTSYSGTTTYNSSTGYFAFPEMVIPTAKGYELAIWAKVKENSTYSWNRDSVEVFYNAEKQSLDGAVKIGAFYPTAEYKQYAFTLPMAGKQFVILKVCAKQSPVFLDDASFRKIPTCFPVENVRVEGPAATSARIVWDTRNEGASYRVTLKQGTKTLYNDVVNGTSLLLDGLTASTMYNLQATIVTLCSDDEESVDIYTGTLSFATECVTITEFPWEEDFEGFATGDFVHPCWENEHVTGSGSKLFAIASNGDGNATHCLQLQDQSAGTYTRLVLPAMNIPEANAYDFCMDVSRHSGSGKPTEGVYVIAGTDTLGFVPRQITATGVNVPTESTQGWYTYTFTIPQAGVQNITILGRSEWGSATNMDNFMVKAKSSTPSSLPTTGAGVDSAIKFIRNGQVFILRNGAIYNALGQLVEVLK